MLFNSISFGIFLLTFFVLYWSVSNKDLKLQNVLILVASYLFYAWWDWRFLSLILFSTIVDFTVGRYLGSECNVLKRKILLLVSLICNLGLLGFFKYYDFFVESWVDAWRIFGLELSASTLNIVLPVGISFYTFQTLSYTIDIYRRKIKPTESLLQFASFVAFFPQLVAGPIERASHLLPQFNRKRKFDATFALSGFYMIIWGLFKKMVVADNCGFFVDQIFNHAGTHSSLELFLGTILFGFQIYGDFSGYSDIAIGVGRLLGFSLSTNFIFPYFSRNIAEFWRRWHISLSTWFRDYVYIPLGGSRVVRMQQIKNVLTVFLLSGFWHGANWTFIIWGGVHGLLFLPLIGNSNNKKFRKVLKLKTAQIPGVIGTFLLVTFIWIFFRADSLTSAINILLNIVSFKGGDDFLFLKTSKYVLLSLITLTSILILVIFEIIAVQKNQKEITLSKYTATMVMLVICFMGVFKNPYNFIYFQF